MLDNVYVLGRRSGTWFVGFHERGRTGDVTKRSREKEAVAEVMRLLGLSSQHTDTAPGRAVEPTSTLSENEVTPRRGRWASATAAG